MKDTESFLAWFAGFVAGDGSFNITPTANNTFRCELAIKLRDDDLSTLMEIQERLGIGTIARMRSCPGQHGTVQWRVCGIDDNLRLIEIFDLHPVRSKKQKDYEIWRLGVLEISKGRRKGGRGSANYDRRYLAYLSQKLKMIRMYEASEIQDFESGAMQLKLGFENVETR